MDNVTIQHILDFAQANGFEIARGKNNNTAEVITGGKSITVAKQGQVTFISSKFKNEADELLNTTGSNLVIIEEGLLAALPEDETKSFIIAKEPKKTIMLILRNFFYKPVMHSIHPTAIVYAKASLGNNVNIGPYSVIEDGVTIGDNTTIGSHVHIQHNCVIGNNVTIKSNSVIGNSGFGMVKNEGGDYEEFLHFGTVIIDNNVQIGSNVCIDRGSLNDTHIHAGVKIDNLVHVAHNVEIGENSLIIANTMIGGSTKIGANCWIAPSVSLRNNIVIGDNTTVGLGSVVTKSFENDTEIAGVPARNLQEFKALLDAFKKLIK